MQPNTINKIQHIVKRTSIVIFVGIFLCSLLSISAYATTANPLDTLKSAYSIKLNHFILWDDTPPIGKQLCILSQRPSLTNSFKALQGQQPNIQPLLFLDKRNVQDIYIMKQCSTLFLANDIKLNASELSYLKTQNLVIITEYSDINSEIGDINLVNNNNRLRFQISRQRERHAGFRFSVNLLMLATKVI